MATRYLHAASNWSTASWYAGSSGGSPTTPPGAGDTADCNGNLLTIDVHSITVSEITDSVGQQGSIALADTVPFVLNCDLLNTVQNSFLMVMIVGQTLTVNGQVKNTGNSTGGAPACAILLNGSTNELMTLNINATEGRPAILNTGASESSTEADYYAACSVFGATPGALSVTATSSIINITGDVVNQGNYSAAIVIGGTRTTVTGNGINGINGTPTAGIYGCAVSMWEQTGANSYFQVTGAGINYANHGRIIDTFALTDTALAYSDSIGYTFDFGSWQNNAPSDDDGALQAGNQNFVIVRGNVSSAYAAGYSVNGTSVVVGNIGAIVILGQVTGKVQVNGQTLITMPNTFTNAASFSLNWSPWIILGTPTQAELDSIIAMSPCQYVIIVAGATDVLSTSDVLNIVRPLGTTVPILTIPGTVNQNTVPISAINAGTITIDLDA